MHPYNRAAARSAPTARITPTARCSIPRAGTRCHARGTPPPNRCTSAEIGPHPLKNTFPPIQPFLGLSIPGRHQPDTYLIKPQKNMIENDTQLRLRLL